MKILHKKCNDFISCFLHFVYEFGSEQGDLSPTLYEFGLRSLRHTPTFPPCWGNPKPQELTLFLSLKGITIMSKYKQVKVNFKIEDFAELELLAEEAELTKAEYIRRKLGNFSIHKTRVPRGKIIPQQKVDPMILYEVAKIGTNLNQIAKHCNLKKKIDIEVLTNLVALEKNLKELI